MYKVKEIYYTLQGEGFHTGRPAIFCRFSGCNLWSGRNEDRNKAICSFCDTDFRGIDGENGGMYSVENLVNKIVGLWPDPKVKAFIVCTGGEPALQLDEELLDCFHANGCIVAIETNGTVDLPKKIDWICVSPKANAELKVTSGNELKLVYPQKEIIPLLFEDLNFDHFFLQPMDGPQLRENTGKAIEYCKNHPKWKLSVQTHKYLHIA